MLGKIDSAASPNNLSVVPGQRNECFGECCAPLIDGQQRFSMWTEIFDGNAE